MTLGAYFPNEYNAPIGPDSLSGGLGGPGFGAYFPNEYNAPIGPDSLGSPDGLGDNEPPTIRPGYGEEMMDAIVRGASQLPIPAIKPIGMYSSWAAQTGDASWQQIAPAWDYVIYPINDAILKAARAASFGHEVNWVAILTKKPITHQTAIAAFQGRPYEFYSSEAVYREDDPAEVPAAEFVYWGRLRDDPSDKSGGTGSIEKAAQMLGGQLAFIVQIERNGQERKAPMIPFQSALSAQIAVGPKPTNVVPEPVEAPTSAAPIPAKPAGMSRNTKIVIGVAVAGGIGYWLWQRNR